MNMYNNINVNVNGPILASSTYKTIVLKGNLPFSALLVGENIKYVIKYDFDLLGETITIPKNCILEFDGGSLFNGTVIGLNTLYINVGDVEIWGRNLIKQGTWVKQGHEEITVDDHLSTLSLNPVQNKVVTLEIQSRYTKDETYNKSLVYNKNEVYNKQETYPKDQLYTKYQIHTKDEVYTRDETYNTNEVYNKEEINNLLSNTPETLKVILDVPEGGTVIDVLDTIQSEDRPNKLFWIRDDNNTHFDEYAWNGTDWVLLASHDYGIDEEVIDNSLNLITGGGVAKVIKNVENDYSKLALLDAKNNVIAILSKEDVLRLFVGLSVDKLLVLDISIGNNKVAITGTENNQFVNFALQTEDNSVILGIDKDGKKFGNLAYKSILDLNMDKDGLLHSVADYPRGLNRTLIMVITDSHENVEAFRRFTEALDDFESITCGLHMGDTLLRTGATYFTSQMNYQSELIRNSKKPVYFCVGNHDSGTATRAIPHCASDKQLYDWFIKPAIDNGWLTGEYDEVANPAGDYILGKLYYSHRFVDDTLLIVLYPFDDGNVLSYQTDYLSIDGASDYWDNIPYDDNYQFYVNTESYSIGDCVNIEGYTGSSFRSKVNKNSGHVPFFVDVAYWEPIPYDPSIEPIKTVLRNNEDVITQGAYNVGDTVNIPNFTEYSFRCILYVEVEPYPWTQSTVNILAERYPKYKAYRRWRWYGEQQLRWFCKKLEYARENNLTVIVAQHLPFSYNVTEDIGSPLSAGSRISDMTYTYRYDNINADNTNQDVILDIINACKTKTTINCSLYPKQTYVDGKYRDNVSSIPGFDFYYDFRSNEEGLIPGIFLVNGHVHKGSLAYHNKYGYVQFTLDTAKPYDLGLIGSTNNRNNVCYDHLNVFTMIPAGSLFPTVISNYSFVRKHEITDEESIADIVSNAGYSILVYTVTAGEKYLFTCTLPEDSRTADNRIIPFISWFDSAGNCVKIEDYLPIGSDEDEDGNITYKGIEIQAPNEAAFLYMNTYNEIQDFKVNTIYKSIHVTRIGNSYMTKVDVNGLSIVDRNNKIINISI